MIARDVILQIAQVLTTLLLAPLLQGVILQFEERVQRGQGPGVFQPYRDLWKLFHKQIVVPDTASWLYWVAPIVAFTDNAHGSDPDSGPDQLPTAALRHGRHPWRRPDSHARLLHDYAGRPRHAQRLWRHRVQPRRDDHHSCRADADSGLCRDHAIGEGDAAVCRQSFAGRRTLHLLEPDASVAGAGFFILLLVETDRLPIHSSTHIEVYMIDEARILEYSGPLLAILRWASMMKQFILYTIFCNVLLFPWGAVVSGHASGRRWLGVALLGKFLVVACVVVVGGNERSRAFASTAIRSRWLPRSCSRSSRSSALS